MLNEVALYKCISLIVENDDYKSVNVEQDEGKLTISIHQIFRPDTVDPVKLLVEAGFHDVTSSPEILRGRTIWTWKESSFHLTAVYLGTGSVSLLCEWMTSGPIDHEAPDFREKVLRMNRLFNAMRTKLQPGVSEW